MTQKHRRLFVSLRHSSGNELSFSDGNLRLTVALMSVCPARCYNMEIDTVFNNYRDYLSALRFLNSLELYINLMNCEHLKTISEELQTKDSSSFD